MEQHDNFRTLSVCLPDNKQQLEYSLAKFMSPNNIDFVNCPGGARLERENNLREFRSAHDGEVMPKSGAGSEYGREQREEARRKKYGIRTRNYNPNDQPWILKTGTGKQQRRYKGTKNGGVSKNATYMAFVLSGNSKLIAYPLSEWYDFTPVPKHKVLNEDEAEEEFSRRDKTFNHFAIMAKKKYNVEAATEDDQEKESKSKSGKRGKSFVSTEFELMSGSDEEDSEKEERETEDVDKNKRKKKVKEDKEDEDRDDEERDDIDEGQEMDYISGTSSDEDMYDDGRREEDKDRYNDVGVAEEEGLKVLGSDNDEEEEEEKKEEDETEKSKAKDSDSESASDSDIETNSLYELPTHANTSSKSGNHDDVKNEVAQDGKRKADPLENQSKRMKVEPSEPINRSDNSIEEIVKRCLMRKPTSATDLLKKLMAKQSSQNPELKNQIYNNLAAILKKLNPVSKNINGSMYFSLPNNKN